MNIFSIIKKMFGSHEGNLHARELNTSSYEFATNYYDIRIIADDDVLIITDDKQIGGLWTGVSNYDPCSGIDQESFDTMRNLITDNFNEACDSLLFKLKEHLYLLNLADCQNRGATNRMDFYLHLCEEKIDIFYPIIHHFVKNHSSNKDIGIVNIFGDGTSIGLAHLCEMFKAEDINYHIEGIIPSFYKEEYRYVSARFRDYTLGNCYEEFDTSLYPGNVTMKDLMNNQMDMLIQAMTDRVKERISQSDKTKECTNQFPTFPCPKHKSE